MPTKKPPSEHPLEEKMVEGNMPGRGHAGSPVAAANSGETGES